MRSGDFIPRSVIFESSEALMKLQKLAHLELPWLLVCTLNLSDAWRKVNASGFLKRCPTEEIKEKYEGPKVPLSSFSTFSTSSSSTQDNLLPSPSGIIPTIQSESLLQIPIPSTITTTSPGNNLNTLVSPLETETRSHTTPANLNSRFQLKTYPSLSIMNPIVNIILQLKPNNL
ncbi:hypothetical protein TNCV_4870771 [Trichonephila clavipes]|nr:hypothetical protein TNCV_4870771 [Trichonephila clavipes]